MLSNGTLPPFEIVGAAFNQSCVVNICSIRFNLRDFYRKGPASHADRDKSDKGHISSIWLRVI